MAKGRHRGVEEIGMIVTLEALRFIAANYFVTDWLLLCLRIGEDPTMIYLQRYVDTHQ